MIGIYECDKETFLGWYWLRTSIRMALIFWDRLVMGDGLALTVFYRYPPHGRKPAKEESGVQWSRVRSPPVSTPAHDLHASGCLGDLRPGDHFEIQWRKNKDFPYGMVQSSHFSKPRLTTSSTHILVTENWGRKKESTCLGNLGYYAIAHWWF